MATEKTVGKNVAVKVEGDILTITVDLKQRHGTSSSGKSETVGTTNGNIEIPDHPGIKLGLNCYAPKH